MNNSVSYPIPVLGSQDDVAGEPFQATQHRVWVGDEWIKIELTLQIRNKTILKLIADNCAKFVIRVNCSGTYFRQSWSFDSPDVVIKIPRQALRDKIEILPIIAASRNIDEYRPIDLNPDYGDESFEIRSGQVLAIGEPLSAPLNTEYDPLRNLDASIVQIAKSDNVTDAFELDFESNRIQLQVDEATWINYQAVKKRTPYVIMMSLVTPVIAEAIYRMKSDEDSSYDNFTWYQKLRDTIHARNDLSLDSDSPLWIAQKLLASPHMNGFRELDLELHAEDEE